MAFAESGSLTTTMKNLWDAGYIPEVYIKRMRSKMFLHSFEALELNRSCDIIIN